MCGSDTGPGLRDGRTRSLTSRMMRAARRRSDWFAAMTICISRAYRLRALSSSRRRSGRCAMSWSRCRHPGRPQTLLPGRGVGGLDRCSAVVSAGRRHLDALRRARAESAGSICASARTGRAANCKSPAVTLPASIRAESAHISAVLTVTPFCCAAAAAAFFLGDNSFIVRRLCDPWDVAP